MRAWRNCCAHTWTALFLTTIPDNPCSRRCMKPSCNIVVSCATWLFVPYEPCWTSTAKCFRAIVPSSLALVPQDKTWPKPSVPVRLWSSGPATGQPCSCSAANVESNKPRLSLRESSPPWLRIRHSLRNRPCSRPSGTPTADASPTGRATACGEASSCATMPSPKQLLPIFR